MKTASLKSFRTATVSAASALLLIHGTGHAETWNERGNPQVDRIVGVWISAVTQRNCANGAVLATFAGMQAIHHGGTLTDTGAASPGTRGPGLGTWQRTGTGYVARFRFARFYPDGNLAGFNVVDRNISLALDGDSLTGASRVEVQDPAGTVIAVVCASDTAKRFE